MSSHLKVLAAMAVLCLTACTLGPESPRGFSLPQGNAGAGEKAFVDLRCNDCHSAAGIEIRDPDETDINFQLGGRSTRVVTYADLVTSIINPSHRLSRYFPRSKSAMNGESRMPNYNEVMKVQELVDLVTWLQPQYELVVVTPNSYETYYP